MIIYIHGFGSCGMSDKVELLRGQCEFNVVAPSLSYVPKLAIDTLKQLIEGYLKFEKVYLIGTSLGGYYALYLANYYNIPAVLINPAINPSKSLKLFLGQAINYYDNSLFEWREEYLEELKEFEVLNINNDLLFLLCQEGDELLDYKEAVSKCKNSKQLVEPGGSHRFDNLEKHLDEIKEFLSRNY